MGMINQIMQMVQQTQQQQSGESGQCGQNDPAQMFQHILQQLTQGQG